MEKMSRHSTINKPIPINRCDCHPSRHEHRFNEQLVCSNCMVSWSQNLLAPGTCHRPVVVLGSSSGHPSEPQKP